MCTLLKFTNEFIWKFLNFIWTFQETRHQLFKLRPSQHASWIGFAMSYHLLGDFATANSVLDTFRQSQVNVSQ